MPARRRPTQLPIKEKNTEHLAYQSFIHISEFNSLQYLEGKHNG